jgi:general secretion pathway protein I
MSAALKSRQARPGAVGRTRAGFTLVEVLVALAIVAVALTAGMRAASSSNDNALRLAEVSAAQWCADNALVNLKLSRVLPGTGESEFSCEQLGQTYRGRFVVRPTPNPNFRRVDARVANAAGQPLITVSTVVSRF